MIKSTVLVKVTHKFSKRYSRLLWIFRRLKQCSDSTLIVLIYEIHAYGVCVALKLRQSKCIQQVFVELSKHCVELVFKQLVDKRRLLFVVH